IQGFADIIPVAIYETDLEYNLTFANRRGYEWFGISPDDIARKVSILQFIAPGDRQRFAGDMNHIISGSGSSGKEYLLLRHDETLFTGLIYGAKITSPESGEPAGVRGVIIDLTERKKGAQDLYESRQRLELALMAGDVSIWDVDIRTMKVRDAHDWLYRTLGYQPADLPDITISVCKNLIHPLDIPRVLAAFLAHMSGLNPLLETQFRLACKDGSWKWVTVRGKVIEVGVSKEPVRLIGTINTIAPPG
ncbi:MAG: PAS domain S-box protein, partial [Methanoregulaceae archaeon]